MDLTMFAPWFALLGSSAAAGTLASVLLTWLQARFPVPSDTLANPLESLLMHALHAPRFVRLTSFVLSGLAGCLAAIGVTRLDGSDPPLLFAALIAFTASQLVHLRDLSPFVPFRLLASEEISQIINGDGLNLFHLTPDETNSIFARLIPTPHNSTTTMPPETPAPPPRAEP